MLNDEGNPIRFEAERTRGALTNRGYRASPTPTPSLTAWKKFKCIFEVFFEKILQKIPPTCSGSFFCRNKNLERKREILIIGKLRVFGIMRRGRATGRGRAGMGGWGGGRLDLFVQKVGRSVWRQNLSESRHILDKGQTWKARHPNEWRRPLINTRTNEILFTGRYGY